MTHHVAAIPPACPKESRRVDGGIVHAGFWRQIAAFLLDSFLLMTVTPVLAWLAFLAALIAPDPPSGPRGSFAGMDFALLAMAIAAWMLTVAYNALFDASAMQGTPGKRALAIKVVDGQGRRIGFARALLRAMVQSPPWSAGYLLALFDRRKRGLHDLIAGTRVVDRWAWTASPDRQSSTLNRAAAWIGVPVALCLGLALILPRAQDWLDAGCLALWQSSTLGIGGDPDTQPDVHGESAEPLSAGRSEAHGMTWGRATTQTQPGVALVSCHGQPYAATSTGSCDAYIGETACSDPLPVLCLRQDGRAPPNEGLRQTWAGGEIALAQAIAGSTFHSQGDADAYCAGQHGAGWRIAEHHDGQGRGWVFSAAGTIASGARFWVANKDMPANCWDSTPRRRTDDRFAADSGDAPQHEPRDVRFSGTVRSFNAGCWADGVCSIVVGNRTVQLPSPHRGLPPGVYGHVHGPPAGQQWVGQRVEVHCRLWHGSCSIAGRQDYYIRMGHPQR